MGDGKKRREENTELPAALPVSHPFTWRYALAPVTFSRAMPMARPAFSKTPRSGCLSFERLEGAGLHEALPGSHLSDLPLAAPSCHSRLPLPAPVSDQEWSAVTSLSRTSAAQCPGCHSPIDHEGPLEPMSPSASGPASPLPLLPLQALLQPGRLLSNTLPPLAHSPWLHAFEVGRPDVPS